MQEFSRSRAELVKSILYTLGGGLLGYVLPWMFGAPVWAQVFISLACLAGCMALFALGEDLRLAIHPDGRFTWHRLGRQKADVQLGECQVTISARPRSKSNRIPDMSITLEPPEGKRLRIDCAPLGTGQFEALCQAMSAHVE